MVDVLHPFYISFLLFPTQHFPQSSLPASCLFKAEVVVVVLVILVKVK